MPSKKGGKGSKHQQIFQQIDEYSIQNSQQQSQKKQTLNNRIHSSELEEQEEGEIVDESSSPNQKQNITQNEALQALNKNKQNIQELYPDSSDEDNDRLQKQKKKRQQFWKHKNQKNEDAQNKKPLTQSQLRQLALLAIQKTNKKVMLMRKKNEKRMQDLLKIRMTQQPYLTTANTHFRGSSSQYSIITQDQTGKAYYHPNHSFRVGQMRLQNFILKNIKQQSTANYLNQVVKFQNYAYQQRKKRRHHIQ